MRRRRRGPFGGDRWGGYGGWAPYVPVAQRRAKAARHVERLRKKGTTTRPVSIDGRNIATSFWGRSWCENLEAYSDYSNRLPRGRTYVRNGSVIDLQITAGAVESLVSGSSVYTVNVEIDRLAPRQWKDLVRSCSGRIGSLIELLQGRFSRGVMEVLAHRETGLFPKPDEIRFSCSCPDSASMCKHVAATLYGVGARLDEEPELFFRLRHVDGADLIEAAAGADGLAATTAPAQALAGADLSDVFGIDLDESPMGPSTATALPAEVARSAPASDGVAEATNPVSRRGRSRPPAVPTPVIRDATPARQLDPGFAPGKSDPARPEIRKRSGSSKNRPALDEFFRPDIEITPAVLLAFGIPRSTFANWVTSGVLGRTGRHGIYVTTAATAISVRRVLVRLGRENGA